LSFLLLVYNGHQISFGSTSGGAASSLVRASTFDVE
jgi:hypothetical protein